MSPKREKKKPITEIVKNVGGCHEVNIENHLNMSPSHFQSTCFSLHVKRSQFGFHA